VSAQVDLLNLMAYDFIAPQFGNPPLTDHHAQLWSLNSAPNEVLKLSGASAVQYVLNNGVPREKLLLGIPLYGRSFLGASGLHRPYQGSGGREGIFEFRELPRSSTTELYDEFRVAAYCIGGDGGFVTYDNAVSVTAKAEYVKQIGLRGLFFWHVGFDRCGKDSLIEIG
jgi:chitinase